MASSMQINCVSWSVYGVVCSNSIDIYCTWRYSGHCSRALHKLSSRNGFRMLSVKQLQMPIYTCINCATVKKEGIRNGPSFVGALY